MKERIRILFLCTGNSCRSQMAEGWARHLKGDCVEPYSAGIETHGLNPSAVQVMAEAGVDISAHRSKLLSDLAGVEFDHVITVCGNAQESCPRFPGRTHVVHVGFDDPPRLAESVEGKEAKLDCYRKVRDEIRTFIETLPESIQNTDSGSEAERVHEIVRDSYARIAQEQNQTCCGPSACCGGQTSAEQLAHSIGYSTEELAEIPEGSNMGLSCGNPVAIASLREGETVLDLGSGGGFDVFIAGRKVGSTGCVIGVDMTPEMLALARKNIGAYRKKTGLDNVEFRLGEIEHLPVPDGMVDVVISNCVINLSPRKAQVWREIARVLKPGGRVSVSDIALLQPLPKAAQESVMALAGCIAGAELVGRIREMVKDAGLVDAAFEMKSEYIDSMAEWSDPVFREIAGHFPEGTKPSDFVTSLGISARKPA